MSQQSERTVTAVFTQWQSSRLKTSSGDFSTSESEDEAAMQRRFLEFEAVELPASDTLDVYGCALDENVLQAFRIAHNWRMAHAYRSAHMIVQFQEEGHDRCAAPLLWTAG